MIKGFYFFSSYRNALKKYKDAGDYEGQSILLHAMLDYIFDNKLPEFPDHHFAATWEFLLPHLDESIKIEEDRLSRKEAQKKAAELTNKKKKEKKETKQDCSDSVTVASKCVDGSVTVASRKNKNKNMNENKNMNASSYEAEAPAPNPFEDEDLLEKSNHASDVTLFEDGQPTAETFDTSPPKSKGEILDYMQSKGHALEHLNVERFWNYYSQRGWRSKTGVPVIWRQKVDEWVVDDQREKIAELEERRRAGGS